MSRCLLRSSGDSPKRDFFSGCRCWSLCWLLGWHTRFGWVWSLGGWNAGELGGYHYRATEKKRLGDSRKSRRLENIQGKMRWDEFQNKWIITDGEVHIRGHKHVFFQTMCFWYTFLVPYVDVLGSRMVCLTFGRAFSIQLCAGTQLFLKFEFLVKCHHFQRLVSLIFLEILSL